MDFTGLWAFNLKMNHTVTNQFKVFYGFTTKNCFFDVMILQKENGVN